MSHVWSLLLSLFLGFLCGCPECGILIPGQGLNRALAVSVELRPLDHWGIPHLCCFFFLFNLCFKCDGFLLFYCDAKPRFYYHTETVYYKVMKKCCGTCRTWWTTGGSGHLLCNMTPLSAEQHIDNNTEELNWNVQIWQLPGACLQAPPLEAVPKLQCGESYNALEE